ncbi:MAG: phosphatidate cytidylyltransferase [Clostridia bacterium]|nr:phosphatidate cytidylyltransferase [Clostridia bacterium]
MKQRILSALVAVLLFVTVLFVSDKYIIIFNCMVSILTAVSVGEIFLATKFFNYKPLLIASIVFAAFVPFTNFEVIAPYFGLVIFGYIVFMLATMLRKRHEIPLREFSLLFMLTALISFAFNILVVLRDMGFDGVGGMWKRDGVFLLLVACCCSWLADTGAYFFGRFLGKHKLCPEISPKKTVEGFIGGIVCNVAGMIAIAYGYQELFSANAKVNLPLIGVIALFGALLGTLGDLSASYIKRSCNIKDFGNIMPGHGGVMDRFDSILLVAPMVYLIVSACMDVWPIIVR